MEDKEMKYVGKKLLTMFLTLFAVTLFVFLAFHVISGDPATSMLGTEATPARVEALREELGLNDPVLLQYGRWAFHFLTGDMGTSYSYRMPVSDMIADKIPVTLALTVIAFVLMVVIAIPLGIYTARHEGGAIDRGIYMFNQVIMAIPPFLFRYLDHTYLWKDPSLFYARRICILSIEFWGLSFLYVFSLSGGGAA